MSNVFEARKEIKITPYRVFPFDESDRIAIYSHSDFYEVTRDIYVNGKWCHFRTVGKVKRDAGDNSYYYAILMAAKSLEIKAHKSISISDQFHVVPQRATIEYDPVLAWRYTYDTIDTSY